MLKYLDHVNIRTHQLEVLKAFYRDVLGLTQGPRPNFSFTGAWMYCGDRPVVHLVGGEADETIEYSKPSHSLSHFAFAAEGLGRFLQHLDSCGVPYRLGKLLDFELCQVNLHDPDGNHIHVDFALSEAESLGA